MQEKSYTFDHVSLILGATIGAGFASGQEIVTFFSRFGFVSIFFAIIFFILFSYSINLLLNIGKKNYTFFSSNYILKSSLNVIFFIVSANMLAGANELLCGLIFDFQFPLYSIVILLISYFVINKDIKAICKVNKILVPIMISFTILVCFLSFFFSPHSQIAINFDISNLAMLSTSSILYTFCNVLIISSVVLKMGKNINKTKIKNISFTSSFILFCLIILITLSLLINDNSIIFAKMPMIYLAFLINNKLGYMYSFVIFLSIITTLLATLYSINIKIKNKNNYIIFIIVFALSLFGFQKIIQYSYPIIGAFGLIIVLKLNSLKFSNNLV